MNKLTCKLSFAKYSLIALYLLLSACAPKISDFSLPKIYKADIYQGSVLERFTINQLKLGMSKDRVQNIIGPPSVIDPFHNNQWDYIHHSTLGSGEIVHYHLILSFEKNKLTSINEKDLTALASMSEKQKALEEKRLTKETAIAVAKQKVKDKALEERRLAIIKQKMQIKALKEKQLAEEKAIATAKQEAKAKALKQQRLAKEKATAIAKQKLAAKALEEKQLAEEKRLIEENKPWYKPW
jgi:outer membrane protein assembly factor BamE